MPHKILLADDSVTVQRVIELTFQDEGMQVVAVGDGRQAIERFEAEQPDIVLADVSMPERDGYEVAAFVKSHPRLSHVPVVLMTGAFEQVDEARAKAAGCDGTLAKPFEPHMVIALVRQLLRVPAALERPAAPPAAGGGGFAAAAGFPFDEGLAPATASLDDYFDRLDEALERSPDASDARSAGVPPAPAAAASGGASAITLADAFSALLAEELGEKPLPAAWGALAQAGTGAAEVSPTWSDEALDALARRVAERISEQMVRDVVATTVADVAERLVREEIERIKAGV